MSVLRRPIRSRFNVHCQFLLLLSIRHAVNGAAAAVCDFSYPSARAVRGQSASLHPLSRRPRFGMPPSCRRAAVPVPLGRRSHGTRFPERARFPGPRDEGACDGHFPFGEEPDGTVAGPVRIQGGLRAGVRDDSKAAGVRATVDGEEVRGGINRVRCPADLGRRAGTYWITARLIRTA